MGRACTKDQRFLEYHAKKETLMMIVDTGAKIHVVCEGQKRRLYDRTTVKEGTITLDTAGGSVPVKEMGRFKINGVTAYPCVVDPLATHSLFSVSLAEGGRMAPRAGR